MCGTYLEPYIVVIGVRVTVIVEIELNLVRNLIFTKCGTSQRFMIQVLARETLRWLYMDLKYLRFIQFEHLFCLVSQTIL
jgi:hypothetical protein